MALMLATVGGAASAAPSPPARYVGHARVLVVSATSPNDPDLIRQNAAIRAEASGLKARDVVVVRAIGTEGDAVRAAAHLPAGRFGVALVGKDGGVKLKRQAPVGVAELFQTIDAMPLRREEMRRTGSDSPNPARADPGRAGPG